MTTTSSPSTLDLAEPPDKPPRFGWALRLFLSVLVFDMVFHSLASLADYRTWLEDWHLERFPKRLPTLQEIDALKAEANDENPAPVLERCLESLDSAWDYFKPWPPRTVRRRLDDWGDRGMYLLSWLTSRLDLFESLAGTPQHWTMFSPNASRTATVARIRLLFKDGAREDIRLHADPPDLTRYGHWFEEKVLDYELKVAGRDWDSRFGFCNYLSHQNARNARGSPLDKIFIYEIRYRYPAPDEDARAILAAQNGPPGWDKNGPDHEYDVARRTMRRVTEKRERDALQKRLATKT